MNNTNQEVSEFHWMMDLLQTIDVGLVVLDRNYQIKTWNSFMENHSGMTPKEVRNKNVFDLFPEIPKAWFTHKLESVFLLKNRSFSSWELRPYLFRFKNYRPITGTAEFMFQDITVNPLLSATGEVKHISIVVYDVTDVAVKKTDLDKANKQLEILSRTDKLTNLNNRGFWEEQLSKQFNLFKRYEVPVSVVMFDIDHFKAVNDTYGHPAGDEVIRVVSKILKQTERSTDISGRYGGEEFGVILPNSDTKAAMRFCERVRIAIEKTTITHEGVDIRITVSLGISALTKDCENYKKWLEQSDKALYVSKEGGRNLTSVFEAK